MNESRGSSGVAPGGVFRHSYQSPAKVVAEAPDVSLWCIGVMFLPTRAVALKAGEI